MQTLTKEVAEQYVDYDQSTGVFRWANVTRKGRCKAGAVAGHVSRADGYVHICVLGRKCLAHRLAWLMAHGRWPSGQIDHINLNRSDNRIANLREATNAENGQNRTASKRNTSGFPGVSWCKSSRKWRAQIRVAGRSRIALGYFMRAEDAAAAYAKAKSALHKFHPSIPAQVAA